MAGRNFAQADPDANFRPALVDVSVPSLVGRRCLVLGAGGFLGQAVVRALLWRGAAGARLWPHFAERRERAGGLTRAAVEDPAALGEALAGQEFVFHLVGSSLPETSNRDPVGDIHGTVLPMLRLLDLCRDAGVRKVVFASSGGTVYGVPAQIPTPELAPTSPICAYGISKLMIERYLELYRHQHGIDYHVLRIANPYGRIQSPFRRQGVVAAALHRGMGGHPIELWGTGEVTRDFIHVDDVAAAFMAAAVYAGPHRIMNVGSGQGRSLNQVLADAATILGLPSLRVVRKPGRSSDVPVSILDASLIRAETGWRPEIGWMEGLADTAAWLSTTYGALAAGPVAIPKS